MKEQAQRNSEEEFGDDGDMTVDSVDSLASFDSKDSSLSLDSFESSASMSTTASYLSQASLGSVVDAMVGETIRVARYVYKPVVDCDIDFYSPTHNQPTYTVVSGLLCPDQPRLSGTQGCRKFVRWLNGCLKKSFPSGHSLILRPA